MVPVLGSILHVTILFSLSGIKFKGSSDQTPQVGGCEYMGGKWEGLAQFPHPGRGPADPQLPTSHPAPFSPLLPQLPISQQNQDPSCCLGQGRMLWTSEDALLVLESWSFLAKQCRALAWMWKSPSRTSCEFCFKEGQVFSQTEPPFIPTGSFLLCHFHSWIWWATVCQLSLWGF